MPGRRVPLAAPSRYPVDSGRAIQNWIANSETNTLQYRELAIFCPVLCSEQDLSHLLDHGRFERLDFRRDLRIKSTLAAVASTNVTGMPE
ncbi:hypothetical protein AC629_09585, partial [Bradyrhizobium sp. NAS80.1]